METGRFVDTLNSEKLKKLISISADQHIRTQQLTVQFKQTGLALLGVVIACAVLTILLWGKVEQAMLLAWDMALGLAVALVLIWYAAFRRFSIYPDKIKYLDWGFSVQALFHGTVWGSIGFLVLATNEQHLILAVIITLVGVGTGSIATTGSVYRSFLCFMLPTMFPISYFLASGDYGETWNFIGTLLLAYIVVLSISGLEFYRVVRGSLQLRFENSGLVDNLVAEKLKSEEMVKVLEKEVGERKKAEQSIRKAMEEAKAANSAKSRFLANMSHEIRTPLASIIGFAEMANEEADPTERKQSIDTIVRSGKHLLEIINDILDLSKIESEKLDVESIEVPVLQMLCDIKNTFTTLTQEKGLDLRVEYDFPVPEIINSDPTRLRQIIFNLVGNAIKFTESGEIIVKVSFNLRKELLFIRVTDNGIGMTEEEMQRLFQPFSQADVSTTRKYGGTGLGLSISKKLANMLGGDIVCESQKGVGSTFVLSVATSRVAAENLVDSFDKSIELKPVNENVTVPVLEGKVLVVDDSPDMQKLVCMFLRRTGVEYETANNGKEGVEAVLSDSFDLVLMDMQMPVMDGLEAIKNLRSLNVQVPILAMTANVQEEEKRAYKEGGANGHLGKPIDQVDFYNTIRQFLKSGDSVEEKVERIEEFSDLVEQFKQRLRELLGEMAQAIAQGDIETLEAKSHVIKGLGGSFGFPEVTTIAAELNQAAKNNDMESCKPIFDQLKEHAEAHVFVA